MCVLCLAWAERQRLPVQMELLRDTPVRATLRERLGNPV